ncbi:MAG: DUF2291 domain-containing protein [Salinisphaera sp.]|uniref:DUF2291 family protein n=1 Tax=Salinisphaera sp. TaxID=1914330 RepID=UPI003C7BBC9F
MPHLGSFATRSLIAAIALAGLLLVLGVLAPGPLLAVRPVDAKTGEVVLSTPADTNSAGTDQKFAPGSFDPEQYVAGLWQKRITPYAKKHAAPLNQVLTGLANDRQATEKRYGVLSGGDTYNFLVHGSARVAKVDTSTPVGRVDLADPKAAGDLSLYAGPLVFGTALRDAFPFLQLNDFTNQMQYASVAKAMNKRALAQAYQGIKVGGLKGKTIAFTGAFAESADGSIQIVPIDIEVKP